MANTLHELLAPTLLRTASPATSLEKISIPLTRTFKDTSTTTGSYPWVYELQYDGRQGPCVRNLTYVPDPTDKRESFQHLQHGLQGIRVCSNIEWKSITTELSSGRSIDLPLERKFLIGAYNASNGHISENETHPFWRLDTKIDVSFSLIFGYNLNSRGNLSPITNPLSANFVENFKDQSKDLLSRKYLICVEFVTCSPSANFEPSGVLVAGRIYPLIWIMSNKSLSSTSVTIRIQRPAFSYMKGMEGMAPDGRIRSSLFTDRNCCNPLIPEWDSVFDYYVTDTEKLPEAQKILHVVNRTMDRRINTTFRKRFGVLGFKKSGFFDPLPAPDIGFCDTKVEKVPRQGYFDNIHIAPRMFHTFPNNINNGCPKAMEVVMAPICQHDCFHTHFRWGELFNNKNVRGWSASGPHTMNGAPLIPVNQEAWIRLIETYTDNKSASEQGFDYMANIQYSQPMEWNVFNHHGSAYGIGLSDWRKERVKAWLLASNYGADLSLHGWAEIYHHLRYYSSNSPAQERVVIDENDKEKLICL